MVSETISHVVTYETPEISIPMKITVRAKSKKEAKEKAKSRLSEKKSNIIITNVETYDMIFNKLLSSIK
jgi:hypothetical protein